jgi:hypothetical protein
VEQEAVRDPRGIGNLINRYPIERAPPRHFQWLRFFSGISTPRHVLRNPMTGIGGCCACAARGHVAAPPSKPTNSRRRIAPLRPWGVAWWRVELPAWKWSGRR